jgi:hypothetical protein
MKTRQEYSTMMRMKRRVMAWAFGRKIMGIHILSCREVSQVLQAYLEGELSPAECRSIKVHLALCSECRAFLSTYRETLSLLGHLPSAPMSREFSQGLENLLLHRLTH